MERSEIARHAALETFLATPGLEAVYVATPNHLHRPVVEAAARAGKHVLCEKPMATSLADAEAMVAACRENGVRYATAFDQRFQARHRRLRELVRDGRLGEITAVRVHYACWTPADWSPPTADGTHDNWRVDPARAGGGAFIDLAPHGLDLAQVLLGEPLGGNQVPPATPGLRLSRGRRRGARRAVPFRRAAAAQRGLQLPGPLSPPHAGTDRHPRDGHCPGHDGTNPGRFPAAGGRRFRGGGAGRNSERRGRFAVRRRDRGVFPLPAFG